MVVLALATLGGGVLAWRQYRELSTLRAAALDSSERADLQKRIWDLEKGNRELSDQLAALRSEMAEDEESAPAPAPAQSGERPAGDAPRERSRGGRGNNSAQQLALRELMAKPEVQAALDLQRKLGVEQRYATLFKNLNLTPDQAEKLKGLLAERQNTLQDILTVGRDQGVNPRSDPEGFRKLITEAQNEINQSIKSIIGEAGFTQMQTYEQTLPQRSLVNDLQQRLSYTSTPLNSTQAEQLIQILATNTPPRGGNTNIPPVEGGLAGLRADVSALAGPFMGGGGGGGGRGNSVPITAEAINQAQGVLSEPQVNALRQLRQQQQAQQQLQQLIRGTMQQTGPARNGGGLTVPGTGRGAGAGG